MNRGEPAPTRAEALVLDECTREVRIDVPGADGVGLYARRSHSAHIPRVSIFSPPLVAA
jgi:hypothetical protein